jgi:predicted esterase
MKVKRTFSLLLLLFIATVGPARLFVRKGAAAVAQISAAPASQAESHPSQAELIPPGKVIEKVVCAKAPTQSYAVYLPSNYSADRAWPILYAFDPGARGPLPVNRFQEAAEKYGWIVVGSNNSQNGSMPQSVESWAAMWEDTHQIFSLDAKRIYLAGFSGGARTAIYFAKACRNCAAGVVAGGAGFPIGVTPSSDLQFAIYGIAGSDDFNFPELRNLDGALAKVGVTHFMDSWDGRHEWFPSAVATLAVEWMEVQAMKTGRRQRDEKLLAETWQKQIARGKAFEEAKRAFDAYRVYSGTAANFAGLARGKELDDLNQQVKNLADTREVKEAMRDERRQIEKQQELTQQINSLLAERAASPDPVLENHLSSLLKELRNSSNSTVDTGQRRVARRVLEGLRIGLFERGIDQLQRQKRYADAVRTFETSTELNPERPGPFYYLASAQALNGDKKKSLQALQKAVERGFSDRDAIINNSAFDSIRTQPAYLQLIDKLKKQ